MTQAINGSHLVRLLGVWRSARSADNVALASALRGLVTDGRLAPGVRLPAERAAAVALATSRTTVTAAYRRLRDTGFAASRRGSGTWTALPGGVRAGQRGLWPAEPEAGVIDLSCAALPAPAQLLDAVREAAADLPRYLSDSGYSPAGLAPLRTALADWYAARGLPTDPSQIMVTGGAQQGFDLALRLLVAPGQSVVVESPTYPNALVALAAHRTRIVPYGLPADGWDGPVLLDTLRQTRARVAMLLADFHNPTGHLMPAELRERLPALAHAAGTDLVVDETFVELPLSGGALPPPVASFDRRARVVTTGGLSKAFWGGLRVGWIRASAPVIGRLAAVRIGVDLGSPVLDQLVAVRLLAVAGEILPARRELLRERRDALVAALRAELPAWRFAVPAGGMSLWVELDAPVSTALVRAAEAYQVRLAPGPRFGLDGTLERFLRLPFTEPAETLVEMVHRLRRAREDVDAGVATPGPHLVDLVA